MRYYSNTAIQTTLVTPVSAAATAITVGTASGFPVQFPYRLTLDFQASGAEVVDVTAAAGTTLTVVRGVDGTSAVAHSLGAVVAHTATAQDYRDTQDHIVAIAGVHGLAAGANVVGTTSTQVLTNKTLDGLANTFTNLSANSIIGPFKSTTIVASNASTVALKVQGFSGQTAPLQQWLASDGSTVLAAVDAAGATTVASLSTADGGLTTATGGGSTFVGKSVDLTALADVTPLKVKAVAAATADVFQVMNSTGTAVFKVAPSGGLTAAAKSTLTQAVVNQTGTTDPALVIAAQSGVANTKPYLQITDHTGAAIAKIDELGFLVGPADAVSLAVTTNVPSSGTSSTKINYAIAHAEFDTRDKQTVAQPTRISITVAGYYLVIHHANFPTNTTGVRGSEVRLNGGANYPLQLRVNPVGSGYNTMVGSSRVLKLAAGDYLEHYVWQDSTLGLNTALHFQCVFLGT